MRFDAAFPGLSDPKGGSTRTGQLRMALHKPNEQRTYHALGDHRGRSPRPATPQPHHRIMTGSSTILTTKAHRVGPEAQPGIARAVERAGDRGGNVGERNAHPDDAQVQTGIFEDIRLLHPKERHQRFGERKSKPGRRRRPAAARSGTSPARSPARPRRRRAPGSATCRSPNPCARTSSAPCPATGTCPQARWPPPPSPNHPCGPSQNISVRL